MLHLQKQMEQRVTIWGLDEGPDKLIASILSHSAVLGRFQIILESMPSDKPLPHQQCN